MSNNSYVVYWALNGYGVTVFDLVIDVVVVILAAWIIGLNIIVLQTLYTKTNKEPSEYYIINLSIADLLTGVYLIHNTVYNMTNFQILQECLIRFGFGMSVTICSLFQLVALSIDRYFKIMTPFKYINICNRVTIIVATVTSWGVAIIIGLLPVVGWQQALDTDKTCGLMKIITIGYFQLLIVVFLVPFFLLLITYLRIFKEARRHARTINSAYPGSESKTTKHSLKFTKTVCIVAGTYVLCWLPMGIVVILHVNGNIDHLSYIQKGNLLVYASALAFVNSLLNPIIYALKMPVIRKRFRSIFCRGKVMDEELSMSGYTKSNRDVYTKRESVSIQNSF